MDTGQYVRRIAGLPMPPQRAEGEGSAELARIELAYRTIIEETGAGVAAVGAAGILIFVNRGLSRMIGYGREELLGRPFADFLHPEDRDRISRLLLDSRKNPQKKLRLEFRALHKDGRSIHCDARPTILPGRGKGTAFYAIINDMTAYREAEEKRRTAHERLQTLLSSTSAVFFASEPAKEFRTTYISGNVGEMTGYEAESFLKNPRFWENGIHPRDRERVLAERSEILVRKSLAIEYRFRRRDGAVIWVREDMRLVEDEKGKPLEIAGFWVDVTARRKAEDLLRLQRDLSLRLNEARDVRETLRLCLEAAIQISETDSGVIYLLEEKSGDLVLGCAQGLSPGFVESMRRFRSDSPQTRLILAGQSIFQGQSPAKIPHPVQVRREGLKSMAAVPIRAAGRIIGGLLVSSKTAAATLVSSRLALENIAGQIGQAIERSRLEEALRGGEEKFRTLTENVNLGVFRNTPGPEGRFLEANPAMLQMLGFADKRDLLSIPVSALYVQVSDQESFNRQLIKGGYVKNALLRLKKRGGSPFAASVSAVAVRDEKGAVKYFDGVIEDITDRQAAEDALRRSEMIHRHLFEQSNDPVLLIGLHGRLIGANQRAADMLGYSKEQLIGFHFRDTIASSEQPNAEDKFKALIEGKSVPLYVRKARRRDGTEFPVEINVSLVRDPNGIPLFIQSIVRDISERVKTEEAIRSALREKETLLREVHHRVKNNMQIIVSLLRLQSHQIKEDALREMFRISQARIQSMALIHEKLYQSRDLAGIDFGAYVEVLAAYLRSSAGSDASRVGIEIHIHGVSLDINRAIPCGLIINELVTNALKYAFHLPGTAARIRIAMSRMKNGRFSLTISDNGVGLPESVSLEKPETLGLQIVADLVRQLDGRLAVDRAGGTTFRIEF